MLSPLISGRKSFSVYSGGHSLQYTTEISFIEYKQRGAGVLQVTTPDDLLLAERILSMSSGKSSE